MRGLLAFAVLLTGLLTARGAPHDAMDYGPFLSHTYLTQWPQDNLVHKGIAVRFDVPVEGEPAHEGPLGGTYVGKKLADVPAVYHTQRIDLAGYRLNLANGKYKVTLQFCETREAPKTGKRVFNVALQGRTVADKLDIVARAGGKDKPLELTFEDVEVASGQLVLDLTAGKGNTSLAGLIVEGPAGVRKIDCGSAAQGDYAADWPAGYAPAKNANLAGIIFDTEMLRVAAGWNGDFINLKGVVFDGGHGSNPSPAGIQRIGTRAAPGWAKDGDLRDPRPIPHGPLPRDWARYKGLYRHDKGTVFAYTVGGTLIHELPGVEAAERTRLFTRTLHLQPSSKPLVMVVADRDRAQAAVESGVGVLLTPEHLTLARVLGGPAGTALEVVDNRLVLKIPASARDSRLKVCLWAGNPMERERGAAALAKSSGPADFSDMLKGGKALWPATVATQGKRGTDTQAYVLDDIVIPFKNPYNSWMRIGGFDLFSDGRAAVSTWSGDVWIVSGIDDSLQNIKWRRYASGLFQALGLKIVEDKVYVLGRDQITRLHDLNNDGEADFYECFNNDTMISHGFHEFTFELQTDPEGNFYFIKGGAVRPGGGGWEKVHPHSGCLFKVSKDGSKLEVVARGFRAPNGMGVGPRGELTSGDNEGTWTPKCPLNWIKPGGFYGVPEFADQTPRPTVRTNPLCWLPKDVDNSNGGQVWITGDKFGPLSGQLLHSSYGTCKLFLVLKEEAAGQMQGGVVPLPLKFDSGICRGRFHAGQNALYITGLRGWQTSAARDGSFSRIRYTGKPANLPVALRAARDTLTLTFSEPLDRKAAEDIDNYIIHHWNYRWTGGYGSGDVKPSNPKAQGNEEVEIDDVKLSADGKTVTLTIADLKPVMQMKIAMKLKAADGAPIQHTIHNTLNVVGDRRGEIHPGEFRIVGK